MDCIYLIIYQESQYFNSSGTKKFPAVLEFPYTVEIWNTDVFTRIYTISNNKSRIRGC